MSALFRVDVELRSGDDTGVGLRLVDVDQNKSCNWAWLTNEAIVELMPVLLAAVAINGHGPTKLPEALARVRVALAESVESLQAAMGDEDAEQPA